MKKSILLSALTAVVLTYGCEDTSPTRDFPLTLKVTYDGTPLEKGKDYDYQGFPVRWSRFNFYISDIILLGNGGENVLSEVEFVDFTPDNASTTLAETVTFNYEVEPGDYTGFRIGFGVRPDLNAKKPADFPPGHPLYIESEYWPGWKSYIFSKIEGTAFPGGSGTAALDLTYHCGGNQTYKVFNFANAMTIENDGDGLTLEIDLKKLFTFNGQLFDIQTTPTSSHGASGVDLMEELMGNFGNATVLK